MKKLLLTLALSLFVAGTATAQLGWSEDEIGFFFDQGGTLPCGTAGPGMASAYLMIKHGQYGVGGWECYAPITAPADGMILSWDLMGLGPLNIYEPPFFMVGLGVPMPRAGVVHVATVNLFLQSADTWLFYVKPLPMYYPYRGGSLPGYPCYAAGEDVNILTPLFATSGNYNLPVAQLNGDCTVVSTKDETWGGVKSLYQ